jgi:hypothetical protein
MFYHADSVVLIPKPYAGIRLHHHKQVESPHEPGRLHCNVWKALRVDLWRETQSHVEPQAEQPVDLSPPDLTQVCR